MISAKLQKIRQYAGIESVITLKTRAHTPSEEIFMGKLRWPTEKNARRPHFEYKEIGETVRMVLHFSWLIRLRTTKRWKSPERAHGTEQFHLPIPGSICCNREMDFVVRVVKKGILLDETTESIPTFLNEEVTFRTLHDEEITISNNERTRTEAQFIEVFMARSDELDE